MMNPKRVLLKSVFVCIFLPLLCTGFFGCRYAANRAYDFADIFQIGAGVAAQNPRTGMWPPALGVHVQATEFLNLGVDHFDGLIAEWDGRGFFAGHEYRTRMGFLPLQTIQVNQDYGKGCSNYFKQTGAWTARMNSSSMRFADAPAKELDYLFWADRLHQGAPLFYRGWQYWENVSFEVGVCEPFVTHLGLHLRAGVDVSEVADFVLGFFCIDFNRDDLTWSEFEEMTRMRGPATGHKPASDEMPRNAPPSLPAER